MGRDIVFRDILQDFVISIHPPRVGRDFQEVSSPTIVEVFQSTLPVWGGTIVSAKYSSGSNSYFNPPSPCGEGRGVAGDGLVFGERISIHPPRVGRDIWGAVFPGDIINFNPPSPCGEGRVALLSSIHVIHISIHPPRVGRDHLGIGRCVPFGISIHPPRVGRDAYNAEHPDVEPEFQSTLPVWGGTPAYPAQ